jgi:hypothetical protein
MPYRVFDEAGHPLDGDHDPKGKHGCRHDKVTTAKKHRATRTGTETTMEEQHEQPVIVQAQPHGVEAITAAIGVPDFDLSKVLPEGGALSPTAAILGGLAIAGGVALKVIPAWFKSRADMATQRLALKAKRLELEQKSKQDEQGGDCASRHAACLAALATLEERVKLVERQADGLMGEVASTKDSAAKLALNGGSIDPDRLAKVEEQVKELNRRLLKSTEKEEDHDR